MIGEPSKCFAIDAPDRSLAVLVDDDKECALEILREMEMERASNVTRLVEQLVLVPTTFVEAWGERTELLSNLDLCHRGTIPVGQVAQDLEAQHTLVSSRSSRSPPLGSEGDQDARPAVSPVCP